MSITITYENGLDSRIRRRVVVLPYQIPVVQSHSKGDSLGVSVVLGVDLRRSLEESRVVRWHE